MRPEAETRPSPPVGSLARLRLALFVVPMGLGGLGLAWREAAHGLGAPVIMGAALPLAAGLAWLGILALHLVRLRRHPAALRQDLAHPIRSAFAGAVTIGLMIIAAGLIPHLRSVASAVWLIAVAGHVTIAAWTMHGLLAAPREAATLTPPLLIPLVGNILAPIFGMRLGFETLSWMMFGIGVVLWLMLRPLLLGRLVTGPALPPRLRPTLAILLAAPAAGRVALAALTGGFGPGPFALHGFALLLGQVLAGVAGSAARWPFAMSWWAWTFPAAIFSVAAQAATGTDPAPWQGPVLWLVLLTASAIVAIVTVTMLHVTLAGQPLHPEG